MIQLTTANRSDACVQLLRTARDHFILGGQRIQYTFPALVSASLRLARTAKDAEVPVRDRYCDPNVWLNLYMSLLGRTFA
jgi:hypothetical protein